MLTREDVTASYQLILGRKPESDEMIEQQITEARTFEGLRDILISSDEFVERVKTDFTLRTTLYTALSTMISFQVSENQLKDSRARNGSSSHRNGQS